MATRMVKPRILVLGSKEYPLGTNTEDPSPSGGMELYAAGLVRELKRYARTTVVTRRFRGTKPYEKIDGVEVRRVPYVRGFLMRNPTFNIMAFLAAVRLKFDIVIAHGEVAGALAVLLGKLKRRPVIVVAHGLAAEQPQYGWLLRKAFLAIARFAFKRANALVTHAPHQTSKLTEDFEVIMPGLDRSKLKHDTALRAKYKIDGRVILFTGRLQKVKGVEYLIRALGDVKEPHTCFIVGDGPQRAELEALAKELGANVIFTGYRRDINHFLSIADAFVMPSVSEALNYSMLEAAHMGVPVIVTDLGIIPDDSAMIVPRGDSEAIANAINSVFDLANTKKIEDMKKRASDFAAGFDWKIAARKYDSLIRRLVK